jgi:hypothetical protein
MTRTEAIDLIKTKLDELTDEQVVALADIAEATAATAAPFQLTAEELTSVAEAKTDHALGRTLTPKEMRASLTAALSTKA